MNHPTARSATEQALLAILAAVQPGSAPEPIVVADASDPVVAAPFLRWFLLQTLAPRSTPLSRFTLWNAHVTGSLSLAGMRLRRTCAFMACRFDAPIDLTDARIVGFEVIGGSLFSLRADRLTASGSLLVRKPIEESSYPHDQPPPQPVEIQHQLLLSGADIRGNADLRGCHLGAALPNGGDTVCVLADGAHVEGHFLLSAGVRANAEVRLNGMHVARNMDLSASVFHNLGGFSISAAGAHVRGTLYICRHLDTPFASVGTVRLEGATIDGDLDATGGRFTATAFTEHWTAPVACSHDTQALIADGCTVGAEIRLKSGFVANGSVRLVGAKVGTDLICSGAVFDFAGQDAFEADGISVAGGTFFDHGCRTNGLLRLVQADLRGGLFLDGTVFDRGGAFDPALSPPSDATTDLGSDVCGVYMPEATVGGVFYFRDVTRIGPPGRPVWLSIQNGRVNTVEDDAASWGATDRIDLRDCTYQIITGLDGATAWRLDLLDREYAPSLTTGRDRFAAETWWETLIRLPSDQLQAARRRFVPQPYLQFASVVRAAGFDSAANGILVRLGRNATILGGYGAGQMVTRWLLDWVLQYGYARWRPVWVLSAWIAVSAIVFDVARHQDRLVPTIANATIPDPNGDPDAIRPHEVRFNALIYATDTLVPLVDLGQKRNFAFREPSWLLVFNSFFGWIMTSFFAAGVSGLLRRS